MLASAYSVTQWKREHPSWFRLDLQALLQLLSEGRIKPVVHAVIPLQERPRPTVLLNPPAQSVK